MKANRIVKLDGIATIGMVTSLMLGGGNLASAQSAPSTPIKIVTYNIASGASGMGSMPFYDLCREIMSQNPDVVVLQEVHDNWPGSRSPGINQPNLWKNLLHPSTNCGTTPSFPWLPSPAINGYY